MANFNSFELDTTQWTLIQEQSSHKTWNNNKITSDVMAQGLTQSPPTDLPRDYPDIRGLTKFYSDIAASQGGQLIEVTLRAIDGVEAIKTITTSPMPDNQKLTRYVGAWIFPLEKFYCSVHFQCVDVQPSHPLTRVHRYLYELPLSIKLSGEVRRANPYRYQ